MELTQEQIKEIEDLWDDTLLRVAATKKDMNANKGDKFLQLRARYYFGKLAGIEKIAYILEM